ncbi:hypothetical protein [Sporosarcina sp. D27]|uniref:hypothetical protein n=1 Tax=Sporosarcina sp. D27 TaxID=1382305 RepID=UPI0004715599|nr:hypothetical protein [Sporosarcina sp. D27]
MNNVELTDNENSLIATSLVTTIASTQTYIQNCGQDKLDDSTIGAFNDMQKLLDKLEREFF